MKKSLLTLLMSLLFLSGFSQELMYEVRGRYSRPVKIGTLKEARILSDFIPGYPVNWVSNYISVEVMSTCNGKTVRAESRNDVLTPEQKKILTSADIGTVIAINVKHKYENPVTHVLNNSDVNVLMTVIPEVEAEYIGGYALMAKYLWKNAIERIQYFGSNNLMASLVSYKDVEEKKMTSNFQQTLVTFTVDEEGRVINTRMTKSSGFPEIDKVLLDAINRMPRWKPAVNSKGVKVKQEFEFSVGNDGC